MNSSFSNPIAERSLSVAINHWKKPFEASLDRISDGTIIPARPLGFARLAASSEKSPYVFMSPWPHSGNLPPSSCEVRAKSPLASDSRFAILNASYRARSVLPSGAAAKALINRSRAALLGAFAISEERAAKNSCSCSLIRSHGGLPSITSNPPRCITSGNSNGQ